MTTTYTKYFTKDGIEDEICVEYTITDIVPATYFEQEEGGEVEILNATIEPSGKLYILTDEDLNEWEACIFADHDFDEDDGI